MGFRANGQFVCPGCRAAVDKTPEPAKGAAPGPVAVVLPKAPPEKRSKQETQHITLPVQRQARGGGRPSPPAVAPVAPMAPVGAPLFTGVVPVAPGVPFSPEVKSALARPLSDTVRMVGQPPAKVAPAPIFPPKAAGALPGIPRSSDQQTTSAPVVARAVVEAVPVPPPQGVAKDLGRGPFASAMRRPTAADGGGAGEPRPGKEYAKFLQEKPVGEAAAPDKRPIVPSSAQGAGAEPSKEPLGSGVQPPKGDKPQGFPWMVPARAAKAEAPAPVATVAVALPTVFKGAAPGAVAKKRTDVIPALRGAEEAAPVGTGQKIATSPRVETSIPEMGGGHEAAEATSPPEPAIPKEETAAIAKQELLPESASQGPKAVDSAVDEGAKAAKGMPVADAAVTGVVTEPAPVTDDVGGTPKATEQPQAEPEREKDSAPEATTDAATDEVDEVDGALAEPSWLEAFARARVEFAKPADAAAAKVEADRKVPALETAQPETASDVGPGLAVAPLAREEAGEAPAEIGEPEPGDAGSEPVAVVQPDVTEPAEPYEDSAEEAGQREELREAGGQEGILVEGADADRVGVTELPTEEEPELPSDLPCVVSGGAGAVSTELAEDIPPPVFHPAPLEVGAAVGRGPGEAFGPSRIAGPVAVPVVGFRKKTDRITGAAPNGEGVVQQAVALPPEVSARALRLADAISGAGAKESSRSRLGAVRDWIDDHLPLLLVTGLLVAVGITVFALWRSAEGKVISQAGFRTPADFQTFQKAMGLVKDGQIREALEAIRVHATRASADPGLRAFYFELRAALGEAPATPAEIGELLQSTEAGHATVARVLAWEAAWHHPDIDGRMRAVKALTQLGPAHRIPLAEREVRKALGDSADAALGPRPAGLDGYRWDERFVRWYYLRAATGDNDARDRLLQWVKDGQADRIRREAASLALLELDEPDAEKITHDVWQEAMRIEAINFRVTTSRALGIDGGKLPPEEVRRIRDWATKELGYSISRAFGLLYEHGIPAGLEHLETTARNDGVYGFPAIAAVAELNRVLGGKALGRMAAIRDYWKAELAKLQADPKEAASEVGQTFQKVIGRIIDAVTVEMARAGDAGAAAEVAAGLGAENDFDKVQAALKLGERGLEMAMPMLVDIAKGAGKPVAAQEERQEAQRVLLQDGTGAAKAYLEGLLADPEAAIRYDAASRLLELQLEARPKAVPAADLAPPKAVP